MSFMDLALKLSFKEHNRKWVKDCGTGVSRVTAKNKEHGLCSTFINDTEIIKPAKPNLTHNTVIWSDNLVGRGTGKVHL